jgi:hypothetical protein
MPAPNQPAVLVEQWFDSWRWVSTLGWETLETMWGLRAPHQLRTRVLAEARQTMADHLRSPEFLRVMRAALQTATLSHRLTSPLRIH